jgi:DNA-binding NarL/FixJ family response regulator
MSDSVADGVHDGGGEPMRILIADDQNLFVEGLTYILEARASDISVVGTASDGQDAIDKVEELRPDIVLMDVRMPGIDGVEACRVIHNRFPETKILMLTTFPDDEYVHAALGQGAIGYLLKNRPLAELITSIRGVRSGILQIDPEVAAAVFHRPEESWQSQDEIEELVHTLTKREREVLYLMLQAHDTNQIANSMSVAVQTVRNYVSSIYNKLHVSNKMDLVRMMKRLRFYLDREYRG